MTRARGGVARSALIAVCVGWLSVNAFAQSAAESAAQAAARDWLVLADRGDAQASWNAAGQKFRVALQRAEWTAALKQQRDRLGELKTRTALRTSIRRTLSGLPPGEYALIAYATDFTHKPGTRETLTLEHEADGQWRVLGYLVR